MHTRNKMKRGLTLLELCIVIAVLIICAAPLLLGLSAVSFQGAKAEFYNVATPMCEGIMEDFLKFDYFDRNSSYYVDGAYRDIVWLVRDLETYNIDYDLTDFPGYKYRVQIKFINPNYSDNLNDSGAVLPDQNSTDTGCIDRSNFLRIRVTVTHDNWPGKQVEAVTLVTPSREKYY